MYLWETFTLCIKENEWWNWRSRNVVTLLQVIHYQVAVVLADILVVSLEPEANIHLKVRPAFLSSLDLAVAEVEFPSSLTFRDSFPISQVSRKNGDDHVVRFSNILSLFYRWRLDNPPEVLTLSLGELTSRPWNKENELSILKKKTVLFLRFFYRLIFIHTSSLVCP